TRTCSEAIAKAGDRAGRVLAHTNLHRHLNPTTSAPHAGADVGPIPAACPFGRPRPRGKICDQRGIEIARIIPFNCTTRLCCLVPRRKAADGRETHGRTRKCIRKGPSDRPGGTAWL